MKIAVLDLETDPFEEGIMVAPFLAGFHDGEETVLIWHENCIGKMVEYLSKRKEKCLIYAHNGGRFDFFFFLPHLDAKNLRIINGRIVEAFLSGHTLRDSFALMPFPLADFDKDKI